MRRWATWLALGPLALGALACSPEADVSEATPPDLETASTDGPLLLVGQPTAEALSTDLRTTFRFDVTVVRNASLEPVEITAITFDRAGPLDIGDVRVIPVDAATPLEIDSIPHLDELEAAEPASGATITGADSRIVIEGSLSDQGLGSVRRVVVHYAWRGDDYVLSLPVGFALCGPVVAYVEGCGEGVSNFLLS